MNRFRVLFSATTVVLLLLAAQLSAAPPRASAQPGALTVSAGGPYSGQVGSPISFAAQAYVGGAPTAAQYQWSFGDGGAATGQTANHTYTVAGTYSVTVMASTGTQTGSTTTTAMVTAGPGGNSIVSAGGPYTGVPGQPISFSATMSSQTFGGIAQFAWSFGDGTTGTGQTTSHTYATAGTYTVTVTVSGANGPLGSATTTATVNSTTTGSTTSTATEQVTLYATCNNVAATWASGTAAATVAAAVSPASGLIAIWRFDNASQHFIGFSMLPGAPNDLTTINRADPIFICMNSAGTFTRPLI